MKTLIEIFDENQIENVIAGLTFNVRKVIFIGYDFIMTPGRIEDVKRIFRKKSPGTTLYFEIVQKYDFEGNIKKLEHIVKSNEECVFDVSGGKEILLACVGTVAFQNKIPIIQFDVETGKFISVYCANEYERFSDVTLSFKETVHLNGGTVVETTNNDFRWQLNKEFKNDLQSMWDICRKDCAKWNKHTNILASFESETPYSLNVTGNKERLNPDRDFLDLLIENKLIKNYYEDGRNIYFSYKNEAVKRTLIKSGNLLELYTYMLLHEIENENEGYYDDILTGVVVDWDGIVYRRFPYPADTQNELDIVVMRDSVPVFVSCKNGEVHKEALYELDIVADKFGGKYAKKVLVSTYMSFNEKGRKHLKTRANDMNIELVHGVEKLTRNQYKELLKNKIK